MMVIALFELKFTPKVTQSLSVVSTAYLSRIIDDDNDLPADVIEQKGP